MKYLLITLLAIIMVGCGEANTKETTTSYILPDGLKDCKIYRLDSGGSIGVVLRVIRCPNSATSTTHSCGKNCTTSNTLIEE